MNIKNLNKYIIKSEIYKQEITVKIYKYLKKTIKQIII